MNMAHELVRDMAWTMTQMQEHLGTMVATMVHQLTLDHAQTSDMARTINQMSITTREMSHEMAKGTMGTSEAARVWEHTRTMNRMIQSLQAEKGGGQPAMNDMASLSARALTEKTASGLARQWLLQTCRFP